MIADEVQTLWAAQEDPNHLTFLIKTQPNYPVLSVMREWGGKAEISVAVMKSYIWEVFCCGSISIIRV